jgi:hypothetical protein
MWALVLCLDLILELQNFHMSLRLDGSLHVIKCRLCIEMEGKDKLFVPKWDSFL